MPETSPLPWHVEITVDGDGVRVAFLLDAESDMIAMVHPPLGGDTGQWKENLLYLMERVNGDTR